MSDMINRFTSGALVSKLRERNSNVSKAEAELIVGRVFDALDASLPNVGDKVRINGFGTFTRKFFAGRTGKNPRTGESVQIADSEKISFKQAKGSN